MKNQGSDLLRKKGLFLTVFLFAAICAQGQSENSSEPASYSIKVGLGLGYLYKGLATLSAKWTATFPSFVLVLNKSSARFSHSLRLGMGKSSDIYTNDEKRPGNNSYSWIPVDYSFTWFCWRNMFKLTRLDGGFGGTGQWMRLSESVDLQTGHRTSHDDDFFGMGPNMAFRWRSWDTRWQAMTSFFLTLSLPILNRSVIRSDLIPAHHGGLWWARTGMIIGIERKIAAHWKLGISYERDVMAMARTRTHGLSMAEMLSAGNYFVSHVVIQVGYDW